MRVSKHCLLEEAVASLTRDVDRAAPRAPCACATAPTRRGRRRGRRRRRGRAAAPGAADSPMAAAGATGEIASAPDAPPADARLDANAPEVDAWPPAWLEARVWLSLLPPTASRRRRAGSAARADGAAGRPRARPAEAAGAPAGAAGRRGRAARAAGGRGVRRRGCLPATTIRRWRRSACATTTA